jgi:hypothetical protein
MYSPCRGRSRLGGGGLKKIAPSGGRPENIWGISCEKSQFYSSKVKKKCINRNYYDLYVLSVKIHGFPIKIS